MTPQPPSVYRRAHVRDLLRRLNAPPTHLIIVAGPRQVGKTTLVRQALIDSGRAHQFLATDDPNDLALVDPDHVAEVSRRPGRPADAEWLVDKWNTARALARVAGNGYVMALDEIQKIS